MEYTIAGTHYTNNAYGWHELARNSHTMSAYDLANICLWNDPNGDWSYADMIDPDGEGMTIGEAHETCRDQILAWAEEL